MSATNTITLRDGVLKYWKRHSHLIDTLAEGVSATNSLKLSRSDLEVLTDKEWDAFKEWAPKLSEFPGAIYFKNIPSDLKRGYSEDTLKQMLAAIGYLTPREVRTRPRGRLITNGDMGEYRPEMIAKYLKNAANQREQAAAERRLHQMYANWNRNTSDNESDTDSDSDEEIQVNNDNHYYETVGKYAAHAAAAAAKHRQTQTRRRGREHRRNRSASRERRRRSRARSRNRAVTMKTKRKG